MTTDSVPLRQCDHVVFVDIDAVHHALVTLIESRDIIDLVYMTIDPNGSPRLHAKHGIPHRTTALVVAPYWWIPGEPS